MEKNEKNYASDKLTKNNPVIARSGTEPALCEGRGEVKRRGNPVLRRKLDGIASSPQSTVAPRNDSMV